MFIIHISSFKLFVSRSKILRMGWIAAKKSPSVVLLMSGQPLTFRHLHFILRNDNLLAIMHDALTDVRRHRDIASAESIQFSIITSGMDHDDSASWPRFVDQFCLLPDNPFNAAWMSGFKGLLKVAKKSVRAHHRQVGNIPNPPRGEN